MGGDSGFIFSCRLSCAHTERSQTMSRGERQNLSSDRRRDPPSLCLREAAPRRPAAVENPRRCLSTPVGLQTQVFCPTLAKALLNLTGTDRAAALLLEAACIPALQRLEGGNTGCISLERHGASDQVGQEDGKGPGLFSVPKLLVYGRHQRWLIQLAVFPRSPAGHLSRTDQ